MSGFLEFVQSHGLLTDHVLADDRWHRTPTTSKPKRRNGAYRTNGLTGAAIDFTTMQKHATWKANGKDSTVDRVLIQKSMRKSAEMEKRRQALSQALAAEMLKRATITTHPYLTAKGFPQETGFVLEGELLVPMREFSNYKTLNSLQRISETGEKKFLSGGKAKNSVYFIGPDHPHETWLVEGLMTGYSLRAALAYLKRIVRVIVCFSSGNLAHVGRQVATSAHPTHVFADHDANGAGQKAAEETGLPWGMPLEVGDANDVHQRGGLSALVQLIRTKTGASSQPPMPIVDRTTAYR